MRRSSSQGRKQKDQPRHTENRDPPRTPNRGRWGNKRLQVSPGPATSGAALELHYWDKNRKLKVRLGLRRCEVFCVIVIIITVFCSLLGGKIDSTSQQTIFRLLTILLER